MKSGMTLAESWKQTPRGGTEEIFVKINLKKLDETLTKWEMKMNWKKTEAMKVGKERARTLLCGNWGQEVGIGGGSEAFGGDDKRGREGWRKRSGVGLGRQQGL